MKKVIALMLALLLVLSAFSGCAEKGIEEEAQGAVSPFGDRELVLPTLKPPTIKYPGETEDEEESESEYSTPETPIETETPTVGTLGAVVPGSTLSNSDMRYVMIYNPTVYGKNWGAAYPLMNTGTLGTQVETNQTRTELLTDEMPYLSATQEELMDGISTDLFDLSGNRGSILPQTYSVGDFRTFYAYPQTSLQDPRVLYNFECQYAGQYCYIWQAGDWMSAASAAEYGRIFDAEIYAQVVQLFGQPRFAEDGGKIHLLFYPMPEHYAGCFCPLDLYTTAEAGSYITEYGMNTDQALVHMNSSYAGQSGAEAHVYSTMAHEFQHLICASNTMIRGDQIFCESWLNEAMSGYVEEALYPGIQANANRLNIYSDSYLIRNGLSLYNFSTTEDDFGVYGQVYLFSMYMSELAGQDVFSKVHSFWRTCPDSGLDEAMALRASVPAAAETVIDHSLIYPESFFFETEDHAWMSKLTLNYYLAMLQEDAVQYPDFDLVDRQKILYDSISGCYVQGGGRILVELTGDTFTIPADADPGLLYVGLNNDFEVVTDFIY